MIALRFGDQGRGLSVGDTLIQGHFNISSLIDYAEKDERENGENAKKTKKKKKSDAPKSADTSNVQVHMNSDLAIDVGDEIKAGIYILMVRSVEYKELNGFRNVSKCLEEFCNRVEVEAEEEEPPGSELSGKIYICELGEAQECVKFLADNMWLLQTAGRRRVYRKLKKKVHSGQTLRPGRLLDFCQEMRQKYYNVQSQVWAVPEPTPDNCPGQCFLAAHGKPLYFMRGWVKDELS